MRRFTFAVLALGCLLLALGTFVGTNTAPITVVSAQSICTQPCSFGDPEAKDKNDHFSFCHVDHGGAGHVICPDSSSIDQPHLNTHETDFCINTLENLEACTGKKAE